MIERGILRPVLPEIDSGRPARRAGRGARRAAGIAPDRVRRLAALLPADAEVAAAVGGAAAPVEARARSGWSRPPIRRSSDPRAAGLSDRRRRGGRPLPAARRQTGSRPRGAQRLAAAAPAGQRRRPDRDGARGRAGGRGDAAGDRAGVGRVRAFRRTRQRCARSPAATSIRCCARASRPAPRRRASGFGEKIALAVGAAELGERLGADRSASRSPRRSSPCRARAASDRMARTIAVRIAVGEHAGDEAAGRS